MRPRRRSRSLGCWHIWEVITIPKEGNRAHFFVSGSAILLLALRLLVVALAIRLDICGPISFRQIRISRDNEQFEVLKL